MRLKLAVSLGNRDDNTDKDERILNGMVESDGSGRRRDDKSRVLKRPACVSSYSLAAGLGGRGQALMVVTLPGAPGVPGVPSLVGIRGDTITTRVT